MPRKLSNINYLSLVYILILKNNKYIKFAIPLGGYYDLSSAENNRMSIYTGDKTRYATSYKYIMHQ